MHISDITAPPQQEEEEGARLYYFNSRRRRRTLSLFSGANCILRNNIVSSVLLKKKMDAFCNEFCSPPSPPVGPPPPPQSSSWIPCDNTFTCPNGSVMYGGPLFSAPSCSRKRVVRMRDFSADYSNAPCIIVSSDGQTLHWNGDSCPKDVAAAYPDSTVYQFDISYQGIAAAGQFVADCGLGGYYS